MNGRTIAALACGLAIALSFLAGQAGAQVSQAQKDAVRANCRSDFLSHCRDVTPGGAEALGCSGAGQPQGGGRDPPAALSALPTAGPMAAHDRQ